MKRDKEEILNNAKMLLKTAAMKYQLSGRKYSRILKLARTIADLNDSKDITSLHVSQALQYRSDTE